MTSQTLFKFGDAPFKNKRMDVVLIDQKFLAARQGFKCTITDLNHKMTAIMHEDLTQYIQNAEFAPGSILALEEWDFIVAEGRKFLLVHRMQITGQSPSLVASSKYNEPIELEISSFVLPGSTASDALSTATPVKKIKLEQPTDITPSKLSSETDKSAPSTPLLLKTQTHASLQPPPSPSLSNAVPVPIASVSPYLSHWTIRAKLVYIGEITSWKAPSTNKDHTSLRIELGDQSARIKATAYDDAAALLKQSLVLNQTYLIARAQIKIVKKKVSNSASTQLTAYNNPYELTFNTSTLFEKTEAIHLPELEAHQVAYTPISEINAIKANVFVDIIGCLIHQEPTSEAQLKNGSTLPRKNIVIADKSNTKIRVTLWDKKIDCLKDFISNDTTATVVSLTQLRVGDFNAKSLSTTSRSEILVNPSGLQEHADLVSWFSHLPPGHEFEAMVGDDTAMNSSLLMNGPGFHGGQVNIANLAVNKTLTSILEDANTAEKPFYTSFIAYICKFKDANCVYKACPADSCSKKLSESTSGSGGLYCEKCNQDVSEFNYKITLNALVMDDTGSHWITIFHTEAEKILGISAADLGYHQETDVEQYNQAFLKAQWSRYYMKCMVKRETFNSEARTKLALISTFPLNYEKTIAQHHHLLSLLTDQ